MLHRASCTTITGTPPRGDNWTSSYRKFCAEHKSELTGFARVEIGGDRTPCSVCHPDT